MGIAGPAGSGKSTVCQLLACRPGFVHLDCDEIARDSYVPGGPAYSAIVEAFGRKILRPDGSIDRRRLAVLVFSNPEMKKRLEDIVHPIVIARVHEAVSREREKGTEALLIEGALLFSSPHVPPELFDLAIWLEAPEKLRRERLISAGFPPDVVELRLAAQRVLSPPPWIRVIDASRPPQEVAREVLTLIMKKMGHGSTRAP